MNNVLGYIIGTVSIKDTMQFVYTSLTIPITNVSKVV